MAYRIDLKVDRAKLDGLRSLNLKAPAIVGPILRDMTNLVQQYAVEHLSGVPFQSETGSHIINKRTGKGAASVQTQYPYGSPFKARVFASALTRYADNPETYNYLAILEYGRGEIKPKYTSAMKQGNVGGARLTIPGGSFGLVSGQNGFRGVTGRYRFVRSIPPMEGKYWFKSAVEKAKPEFQEIVDYHIDRFLNGES